MDHIPNEVLLYIFEEIFYINENEEASISFKDLFKITRVCKRWNQLVSVLASDGLKLKMTKGWKFYGQMHTGGRDYFYTQRTYTVSFTLAYPLIHFTFDDTKPFIRSFVTKNLFLHENENKFLFVDGMITNEHISWAIGKFTLIIPHYWFVEKAKNITKEDIDTTFDDDNESREVDRGDKCVENDRERDVINSNRSNNINIGDCSVEDKNDDDSSECGSDDRDREPKSQCENIYELVDSVEIQTINNSSEFCDFKFTAHIDPKEDDVIYDIKVGSLSFSAKKIFSGLSSFD